MTYYLLSYETEFGPFNVPFQSVNGVTVADAKADADRRGAKFYGILRVVPISQREYDRLMGKGEKR